MSTRQLNLGDFAAHCLEEIQSVQDGDTVIELLSSGKVVAVLSPPPQQDSPGNLAGWVGSGAGTVAYAPGVDPDAPVLMFADDAQGEDFWHPLTAREQAALQKIPVVRTLNEFYGDGTTAEWEGFDEALEQWRAEQLPTGEEAHAA